MTTAVFLGIDIGTSGIRGSCIDAENNEVASGQIAFEQQSADTDTKKNEQDALPWRDLLEQLIAQISQQLQTSTNHSRIAAIAIDGTSSSLIACKKDGTPLSPALMYNDQQSQQQAKVIRRFAPKDCAVHSASSSLAKALFLLKRFPETQIFCHQADWLASHLTGIYGVSDENNCLKLGYDSRTQQWPEWLLHNKENTIIAIGQLPRVVSPGQQLGPVRPEYIKRFNLAEDCVVIAGTTDSNAAVLATGADKLGDAVTSLGSTLVLKLFTPEPLFLPEHGIYSHHLNQNWLVGGASNSGGCVLLQYFTREQLDAMTPALKPDRATGLDYYPLPGTGERFPINDINKKNVTSPRPDDDVIFFQALLEGIARIEADGYNKLTALGSTVPLRIFTAGGGSKNAAWTKIRERISCIPVICAEHSEACYGSALLAKKGYIENL